MLENFIYIKQKDLFIDLLEAGNVLDEAIVFIEDTREIWNHGTYFDGNAVDLSNVEKSIQDILDNIPTKVSDLENDSGFITGETLTQFQNTLMSGPIQSINNKTIELENNKADKTELPTKVSDLENDKGYLTEHQDISHLASRTWVESQGYAHQEDLLEISFNDIQDSPISIDDSGMINFVDESGNVGMKVSSNAVYAKDFISGEHILSNKQDFLISGYNIKTINGESIVGSGDIVISGGSSSGGNEGSTCTIVNHNASDVSVTIQPNTFHIWGVLSENEYFFDTPIFSDENIMIQFTIGNTIPTLEFTYGLIWNTEPTFSANTVYQISITGSLAIVVSFDAIFDIDGSAMALGSEKKALYGQTWEEWVYSDYNTGGAEINSEGYLGIYDLGDDFVLAGDINTGALCKDTDKISPISSYADFII